jgi:SlyX protein
MNDETVQRRIDALEMKLAYVEDFLAKLQAVTVEHSSAIDHLAGENRAIRTKIGELSDSMPDMPSVKPPHY